MFFPEIIQFKIIPLGITLRPEISEAAAFLGRRFMAFPKILQWSLRSGTHGDQFRSDRFRSRKKMVDRAPTDI